jgi:hypothetical protein
MESNGYISMVQNTIEKNTELLAFSDYKNDNYTFREVGKPSKRQKNRKARLTSNASNLPVLRQKI